MKLFETRYVNKAGPKNCRGGLRSIIGSRIIDEIICLQFK